MTSTWTVDAKRKVASEIKGLIQEFVELTVEEENTQVLNPECDETWNKIVELLNQLIGE